MSQATEEIPQIIQVEDLQLSSQQNNPSYHPSTSRPQPASLPAAQLGQLSDSLDVAVKQYIEAQPVKNKHSRVGQLRVMSRSKRKDVDETLDNTIAHIQREEIAKGESGETSQLLSIESANLQASSVSSKKSPEQGQQETKYSQYQQKKPDVNQLYSKIKALRHRRQQSIAFREKHIDEDKKRDTVRKDAARKYAARKDAARQSRNRTLEDFRLRLQQREKQSSLQRPKKQKGIRQRKLTGMEAFQRKIQEKENKRFSPQRIQQKVGRPQKSKIKMWRRKELVKKRNGSSAQCLICLESVGERAGVMFSKECRHLFCRDCLAEYVVSQIKAYKEITCPQESCAEMMRQNSAYLLGLPLDQRQKYYKILIFHEISKQENKRLCPDEHCQGYVDLSIKPVVCVVCGVEYCSKCMMPNHRGVCDDNGVNFLEDRFNFRRCGKCRFVVEKNQGCNHMTCRCGHQFCYSCGGLWSNSHQCPAQPVILPPQPVLILPPPQSESLPLSAALPHSRAERRPGPIQENNSESSEERDIERWINPFYIMVLFPLDLVLTAVALLVCLTFLVLVVLKGLTYGTFVRTCTNLQENHPDDKLKIICFFFAVSCGMLFFFFGVYWEVKQTFIPAMASLPASILFPLYHCCGRTQIE